MTKAGGGALEIVLGGPGAIAEMVSRRDETAIGLILAAPRLAVLQMTAFGPAVRIYEEDGLAMAERIVAQSRGKTSALGLSHGGERDLLARLRRDGDTVSRIHHATAHDGLDAAVAEFRLSRATVPVARVDEDGRELSVTWTVAPMRETAFERGDTLVARFRRESGRVVIHWADETGVVGIHVVLPREGLSGEEEALEGSLAVVLDSTFGVMPDDVAGRRTVQILTLEAPTAFLREFVDGKLPRHGGLDILGRMAA